MKSDPKAVEKQMRELTEELQSMSAADVDLDDVERRVRELANAWGRTRMEMAMKRADTSAPEVEINGERWGNRRSHAHEYQSVFGAVTFERGVYQQSGRGRVAVPLDVRLGIVESSYTPRLARIATRALAGMPEEEAAELLRARATQDDLPGADAGAVQGDTRERARGRVAQRARRASRHEHRVGERWGSLAVGSARTNRVAIAAGMLWPSDPIGTGVTEAAAKTIVGTRMKRAGARFSQHGSQTVMLFRAALLSGRFAALHDQLHQTYRSNVRDAA